MSQEFDPSFTLFTLHGLAVALRDRADCNTERAEALLVQIEDNFQRQLRGEPIVLGIRQKPAPRTSGAGFQAPLGAPLCPAGAHRAQARMVAPQDARLGLCVSPSLQPPTAGTPQSPRRRALRLRRPSRRPSAAGTVLAYETSWLTASVNQIDEPLRLARVKA